ncbi:glycosyltransferase [Staphylococcus xylosus]|uniref:glycosyltransferase n=2 Tax=Staphylococcus xylosus TaxID=1288 RepID=UPI001E4740A0|nr:glycosyltransferase [Staphylococcus xylosus]
MKHIFLVIFDLNIKKGGKTTSLLTRAKIFNDYGIETDIVTFDYKSNYEEITNELRKINKLDSKTKVHNQFYFFEEKSLAQLKSDDNINELCQKIVRDNISIKKNENEFEIFSYKTGEHIAHIKYKNNSKDFILDIYENNYRIKRIYSVENWIRRVKEFNIYNVFKAENFYNRKGQPFIRRVINENTNAIEDIYLLSENKHFKNNKEFGSYFLDNLIKDDSNNIIICDGTGSLDKIINSTNTSIQKYAVMHTTHKTPEGKVKKVEENVLNKSDELTGVVFLTQDYIDDVKIEYNIQNEYLIPNFIQEIPQDYASSSKKIIGCISRIVEGKGFDLLLNVASIVKESNPEIEFHIYGEGNYKDKLKELIYSNNLEKNVKLFGYTTNPYETLKDFRCVISTSQSEVQSLSMIEGMLAAKPIIAFDIKYGFSQFVFNNRNGYLIPNKDIKNMAQAVIDIMEDDKKYIDFGEESRRIVLNEFNPDSIVKQWLDIFNENE